MRRDGLKVTVGLTVGLMALFMAVLALGTIQAAAETPVQNFEWQPEVNVTDSVNDQYPRAMMEDMKTGEMTLLYSRYELTNEQRKDIECNVVAVLNRTTLQWEDIMEMNYTKQYIPTYFAYDNHVYMIHPYWKYDHLTISIDDPNNMREVDYEFPEKVSEAQFGVLEMDGKELVLWVMYRGSASSSDYGRPLVQIITVDMDTFTSTNKTILPTFEKYSGLWDFHYEDGQLDMILVTGDLDYIRLYMFRYNLETGTTTGPELFDEVPNNDMGWTGNALWSPDGTIHAYFPQKWPFLRKYSADGEFIGEFNLTGIIPAPDVRHMGTLPLMVNRTGTLYLAQYSLLSTYVMTVVISPDYSDYIVDDALEGDFEVFTLRGMIDADDHVVLVYTKADRQGDHLRSTIQVPATPDLEVDPSSFVFIDDFEHGNEHIAFTVRNIGLARAEGYNVTVTCSPATGDGHILVGSEDVTRVVRLEGTIDHEFPSYLPGGPLLVTVTISRTLPRELWTENNIFQMWINVGNKPPVLELLWPHSGTFVDDELTYQGGTWDPEDPEGVVTNVHLPGSGLVREIVGSGEWGFTVDVTNVTSGEYDLHVSAWDGQVLVTVRYTIFVDHPGETLTVDSLSPEGDVGLIAGEGQAFAFEAADLFHRPIVYTWTLDGATVAEGAMSYAYMSSVAGEHVLLVEASNTRHTVSHEWTIKVRDPVAPSISPVEPEGDMEVNKGTRVHFLVAVDNPDSRTYTVQWSLDGAPVSGDDLEARTLEFALSGRHHVRAMLVAVEGVSLAQWTVNVVNRAPTITGATPDDGIDITEPTDVTFRIEADDPDGDDLQYAWSSSGLDLRDLAGPAGTVRLPCDDDQAYTVTVTVTDGEDEATWAWTVRPDPPAPPVNHAPVLNAAHPSDDPIVIRNPTVIDFSVEAVDEDGHVLTYTWGSSLMTMDGLNASSYSLECPCDEEGQYTVWVDISDGEHKVRAEWTVRTEPREESPDMQNGGLPIVLVIALVAVVGAVAVAYIYMNRSKSGQE